MQRKERFVMEPSRYHTDPVIGAWLWAFEDARRRTLEVLAQVDDSMLDWLPEQGNQSINTVLYHLALVEADWLYAEVLETPYPADIVALFPHDARDEQGLLTKIKHTTLQEHLERLATVRERILATYTAMNSEDFRRPRALDRYDVTPEWVLHHLMQHEAQHRAEIDNLRIQAHATNE